MRTRDLLNGVLVCKCVQMHHAVGLACASMGGYIRNSCVCMYRRCTQSNTHTHTHLHIHTYTHTHTLAPVVREKGIFPAHSLRHLTPCPNMLIISCCIIQWNGWIHWLIRLVRLLSVMGRQWQNWIWSQFGGRVLLLPTLITPRFFFFFNFRNVNSFLQLKTYWGRVFKISSSLPLLLETEFREVLVCTFF